MQWSQEAEKKLNKIPFFVRNIAKNETEKVALKNGISIITPELVDEVKNNFFKRSESKTTNTDTQTMESIVDNAMKKAKSLSYSNQYFEVKICGTKTCPLSLVNAEKFHQKVIQIINESGLIEFMKEGINGPILIHHKFKVAIAGCPNNCSEPQIKDFGVVAISKPALNSDKCTKCGECVKACPDKLVKLGKLGPIIDMENCISCGRCINACKEVALFPEEFGYKILIGGHLGRRPELAKELPDIYNEDEVIAMLKKYLDLMITKGKPGQRLGIVLAKNKGCNEL